MGHKIGQRRKTCFLWFGSSCLCWRFTFFVCFDCFPSREPFTDDFRSVSARRLTTTGHWSDPSRPSILWHVGVLRIRNHRHCPSAYSILRRPLFAKNCHTSCHLRQAIFFFQPLAESRTGPILICCSSGFFFFLWSAYLIPYYLGCDQDVIVELLNACPTGLFTHQVNPTWSDREVIGSFFGVCCDFLNNVNSLKKKIQPKNPIITAISRK